MKTLYTADIHASPGHLFSMLSLAEKQKVDRIVVGGDLVPHHLPDEGKLGMLASQAAYLRNVFIPAVEEFKTRQPAEIYLDFANDDLAGNRRLLEERDGILFHLLHMKKSRFSENIDIIGYMTVPPTPFGLKDWEKPDSKDRPCTPDDRVCIDGITSVNGRIEDYFLDLGSDDTIQRDLETLSELIDRPFLFVSHCPPYGTPLDVLYNGRHAGSISIHRFIEKWAGQGFLIASFHGHIHESPARSGSIGIRIGNSISLNPGQGNGPAEAFQYVLFELTQDQEGPIIDILTPND